MTEQTPDLGFFYTELKGVFRGVCTLACPGIVSSIKTTTYRNFNHGVFWPTLARFFLAEAR